MTDTLVRCSVCLEEGIELLTFPCGHQYCASCVVNLLKIRHTQCPCCRANVFNEAQVEKLRSRRMVLLERHTPNGDRRATGIDTLGVMIMMSMICSLFYTCILLYTHSNLDTLDQLDANLTVQMAPLRDVEAWVTLMRRDWINGTNPAYRLAGVTHHVYSVVFRMLVTVFGVLIETLALIAFDCVGFLVFTTYDMFIGIVTFAPIPTNTTVRPLLPETLVVIIDYICQKAVHTIVSLVNNSSH